MQSHLFRLVTSLLVTLLLGGCAGHPTFTRIPLAQRDLSQVVLQRDDIPSEFGQDFSSSDDEDTFPDLPDAHTGLVNYHHVMYTAQSSSRIRSLFSWVRVYNDEEQAVKAYNAIRLQLIGDDLEIPQVGSEAHATYWLERLSARDRHTTLILWRYPETVAAIIAFDSAGKASTSSVVELAQAVQARIEGR